MLLGMGESSITFQTNFIVRQYFQIRRNNLIFTIVIMDNRQPMGGVRCPERISFHHLIFFVLAGSSPVTLKKLPRIGPRFGAENVLGKTFIAGDGSTIRRSDPLMGSTVPDLALGRSM